MTFTNENWNEACSNPSGFHGAKVEGLFGKIFVAPNVIKGGAIVVLPMYADTDVLPMYADTDNPEQATIVYYLGSNSSHSSQFAYGDLIKVNGKVVGEFKGKNRMGRPITGPTIEAASVTKTDVTALMQGGKYVTVKQHQDQNGVVITVDKMVLRDNETDVFIRVKNNQPSQTAYFFGYPYHAMLQVGNQQFNEDILKENLYGQIPSDILPGVEVQGILAFPAIGTPVPSMGAVSLRLEASSENYTARFKKYVFNISW